MHNDVIIIFFFASTCVGPGLPDGLFSDQKYQFGYILEGLRMENARIFHGHLEYIFYGHLVVLW
jgi:hypothetical protein